MINCYPKQYILKIYLVEFANVFFFLQNVYFS